MRLKGFIGFFKKNQIGNKGFTLVIDVMLFLTAFAIILGLIMMLINHFQNQSRIQQITQRGYQLYKFLIDYYQSNLQKIKTQCQGFSNCPYTLTPVPVSDTTFRIYTDDLGLLKEIQSFCNIDEVEDNVFDITCYSPYSGKPFKIEETDYQNYKKPYYAPYEGKYFAMKITEPDLNISMTYVLDKPINKSLTDTSSILKTLKQAIENWALMRYQYAIGNACGNNNNPPTDPIGGLGSWDDQKIPWIWQALSEDIYTTQIVDGQAILIPRLCSGIEVGCKCGNDCGCENFQNALWWLNDYELCRMNQYQNWVRFLSHLNLPASYATDGFGNILTFVPLSDSNGNPVNCPPPRPQCCYPNVSKTGRLGVYDSQNNKWLYFVQVVYPY